MLFRSKEFNSLDSAMVTAENKKLYNDLKSKLAEEGLEMFPWLPEYMKTDIDKLATMMLCSRIVAYTDKGDNPYYKMMLEESVRQFPVMHEKTVQKVSGNTLTIASYFNGDAAEFVKQAPADAGFISFPPFKKAGKALNISYPPRSYNKRAVAYRNRSSAGDMERSAGFRPAPPGGKPGVLR